MAGTRGQSALYRKISMKKTCTRRYGNFPVRRIKSIITKNKTKQEAKMKIDIFKLTQAEMKVLNV